MHTGSLPQATNRQSWSEVFEMIDAETGEANDISDVEAITFAARQREWPYHAATLTLTLGSGITLIDDDTDSKFQIDITVDQMRTFCAPGTYDVGITMLLQGETVQLFAGTWPIIDGVVS